MSEVICCPSLGIQMVTKILQTFYKQKAFTIIKNGFSKYTGFSKYSQLTFNCSTCPVFCLQCFNKEDVYSLENLKRQSWGVPEGSCAEPPPSQSAEKKQLGSRGLRGAALGDTPVRSSEKNWSLVMHDGTKAKQGNYMIHVHIVKNSSTSEQWLLLIQITCNPLPPWQGLSISEPKQLGFMTKSHY